MKELDEHQSNRYTKNKPTVSNFYDQHKRMVWGLIAVILGYVITFVPLPYYVFTPGSAESILPMISIPAGYPEEKGSIRLTTVLVHESNIIQYVTALVHPYKELQLKSTLFQLGESENDYAERQVMMMETSQDYAIYAAYTQAGIEMLFDVVVVDTLPDMPAAQFLNVGDKLLEVDDQAILAYADLQAYLRNKSVGDTIALRIEREGVRTLVRMPLALLPDSSASLEKPRAGMGLIAQDKLRLNPEDQDKKVTITAGDIGGPSAGLMFALEIYNQLVPEDITQGYTIAGTGTIQPSGEVGVIGGIEHKVIAADQAGADIFFAPKDIPSTGEYAAVLNYTTAVKRAQQIGSAMQVIEVDSLAEALSYLASLPPK